MRACACASVCVLRSMGRFHESKQKLPLVLEVPLCHFSPFVCLLCLCHLMLLVMPFLSLSSFCHCACHYSCCHSRNSTGRSVIWCARFLTCTYLYDHPYLLIRVAYIIRAFSSFPFGITCYHHYSSLSLPVHILPSCLFSPR